MTQPTTKTADEEASAPVPARIAGRYVVKRLLGRGGFGSVYEAFDELEERQVALKVIRSDASLDPRATRSRTVEGLGSSRSAHLGSAGAGSVARRSTTRNFGLRTPGGSDGVTEAFKDEFRLLTHLHHPYLAEVYDFGRCEELDGVYFTQELVEGPDLNTFLREAPRETVVEVFVQLARALDYIHALGLVHEDIKPTNVLVTQHADRPHAKLIDFGLARMLRQPVADPEKEGEITVLGTPGFSAPEKVRGKQTDHRSDIYSLAATVYAACRGQRPFSSKDFKEALKSQEDWRPELAGALLEACGPVVAELVGRMLQPDPERRPQSARSIVLELLRRESAHVPDAEDSRQDRSQFARVLVEHLPFIDRASYLDIMLARANEVLLGEGGAEASRSGQRSRLIHTIIVEAPEGMGKQRIMGELRREIQLGGGLFVEGSCWTTDRSALGPFAPIVLQLSTALGDESPVVSRFKEFVALARDRGTDRGVAGQLIEFLVAAANERPYALHLSELARGQEQLPRFEQLAHAIEHNNAPILLCATTVPHTKLSTLFTGLTRDQVAELWHLRPFTQREMYEVLLGVLGDTQVIPDLVKMLDKLTGGHPLSFRETLRVLIEEQILVREGEGWSLRGASAAAQELHKTLAQRSESRLDGLGVSAWEVASILYLLEAPIDEGQLADLSDLRKERFRRTLDRLEGEGLVMRSAASGSSQVSLAHESVREAVRNRYEDSLDETRLDLAARIEELETDDPNFLFLRARLLDDASMGVEAVRSLEDTAVTLFAKEQPQLGAQVCERLILRLRRHGGPESLRRLLDAELLLLNEARGTLDDRRAEAQHWESGILLAEILQDFRAQALFWLGLADRFSFDGEDLELIVYRLERAAEAAVAANDRVLELLITNRRAEALVIAGEIEQAGSYSRRAMEIIDIPHAKDGDLLHIIGVRLRCLSLSGQLGEARRLHDMAKPIVQRVPVTQRQSYLSGIAFLSVLSGDPQRGIPEMEQTVKEIRLRNTPRLLHNPLHNLGDLYLRNAEFDRAAETFREAQRLASLYGGDNDVYINMGFLGYTLARMGDPDEGAALLAEAKTALSQNPAYHVSFMQVRLLDAEVAHMLGQSARARRELEEMLADFHASNEIALAHWAQDALARIERDLGHSFISSPPALETASDPEEDTVRTKPIR